MHFSIISTGSYTHCENGASRSYRTRRKRRTCERAGRMVRRQAYEGMTVHWQVAVGPVADIMNRIPKVVFSNTLETADWNNTRLVRGSAVEEVARLKREPGRDMLVFGSAEL